MQWLQHVHPIPLLLSPLHLRCPHTSLLVTPFLLRRALGSFPVSPATLGRTHQPTSFQGTKVQRSSRTASFWWSCCNLLTGPVSSTQRHRCGISQVPVTDCAQSVRTPARHLAPSTLNVCKHLLEFWYTSPTTGCAGSQRDRRQVPGTPRRQDTCFL